MVYDVLIENGPLGGRIVRLNGAMLCNWRNNPNLLNADWTVTIHGNRVDRKIYTVGQAYQHMKDADVTALVKQFIEGKNNGT